MERMILMEKQQEKKGAGVDYDKILAYDDNNSIILKSNFHEELEHFKETYQHNESCSDSLFKKRGWKVLKIGRLDCICPKCEKKTFAAKRARTYTRKVKDSKSKELKKITRVEYRCSQCRKEFNVTTGTLFEGYAPKLWLCFLSTYCMGLLNGKIPRTFLIKEYYKFLVDEDELYSSEHNVELKIRDYKNIGDQVRRITQKLETLYEEGNQKKKRTHLRYVGFEKTFLSNYLDWYNANRKNAKEWRISWTPGPCRIDNEITVELAKKRNIEHVYDVQYIRNMDNETLINKWVLCFELYQKRGDVENIRWLHVDQINYIEFPEIDEMLKNDLKQDTTQAEISEKRKNLEEQRDIKKRFAKYQLIQIIKNVKFLQRPFRITNDFREAFSEAVLEYRRSNILKLNKNNVLSCPEEILHKTARYMDKAVAVNTEIKGSLLE